MVSLQGSTFIGEGIVTEYDSKTGKPAKYSWEPCKKFGTDFAFGEDSYWGNVNVKLTDEVIQAIKNGPVCFDVDDKRYIAKFETKDYSHCTESLVYISEARKL